jgi:endoribonuclease Dicer
MRQQSLIHASVPCAPLDDNLYKEAFYEVEATGAVVNLSSSVSLLYFYCSRLPSDGFVLDLLLI